MRENLRVRNDSGNAHYLAHRRAPTAHPSRNRRCPALTCTLWIEWQVVQVRPSRSKSGPLSQPGHCARQHRDRVVTAVAMTGKLDSLGSQQDVDAVAIEGRTERVGVERLAPLVVRLLVAMSAVLGIRKRGRLQKIIALCRCDFRASRYFLCRTESYSVSRILSAYALRCGFLSARGPLRHVYPGIRKLTHVRTENTEDASRNGSTYHDHRHCVIEAAGDSGRLNVRARRRRKENGKVAVSATGSIGQRGKGVHPPGGRLILVR